MTSIHNPSLALEELEKDEFLQQIQSPSFSIQNHVTSLLTSSSVNLSAQIQNLTQSLSKLDQAIHAQVSNHHGDLLAQTSNVEVMDSVVLSCSMRAKQCLDTVDKLKLKMSTYETQLADEISSLEQLLKLRSLLRRSRRIMDLEKIPNLSAAKQARIVSEIEYLCTGAGSDPIMKSHLDKANGLRRNIKKQTENMLNQGLSAKSSAQISSSLQIFINLNSLDDIIAKTFGDIEKSVTRDLNVAFNLKLQSTSIVTKGPPGRAASLISSDQGSQIWPNLEVLNNKVLNSCSKIKLLWLVLQTYRDCDSNMIYAKFLNEGNNYFTNFWSKFVSNFEKDFGSTSEVIQSAFESSYPKLLTFVNNLSDSIEEKNQPTAITPELTQIGLGQSFRNAIAGYEKAYLSKSLSKLFDHVNHVFVSAFPTDGDVDELISLFRNSLDVTTDEHLKKQLCRNVSKTIHLFNVRCENLIINDGGATQVIGPPTASQQTNAKIVNVLEYFKIKLKELTPILPAEDLESISTLQKNIIWSLVNGIADAIEAIILTIHQEQWSRTNRTTEYSLYIGELQAFIARAAKDYLNLHSTELIQKCAAHLSSRTIDLITRHASILPQLNSIKPQISKDLVQMEIVLSSFTPVLSELGKPYKLLKGFKTLLNIDYKEIEESTLVPHVVPASLALNYLFTISDDELLVTPQASRGWSAVRYSRWLDEKSEAEKVNFIKSALNDYVKNVSATGRQEFHGVYPIMLNIVKRVT